MQYSHAYSSKPIKIWPITTSEAEIRQLIKAWVMISLAFAIVLGGLPFSLNFFYVFIVSSLTVGIGFLLHELAHKVVAQHYGCVAEFRAFSQMLWLALIMSFFGFIFAAPGAVFIHGPVGIRRNGKISAAGPVTNLALALIFLVLWLQFPVKGITMLAQYGFMINSWLALFNMIPIWNFDGIKVLRWNKLAYGIIAGTALLFVFGHGMIIQGLAQ